MQCVISPVLGFKMAQRKRHLVLVRGGASEMGPISRMGLWRRFPQVSKRQQYLMITTKALLVASIAYYLLA